MGSVDQSSKDTVCHLKLPGLLDSQNSMYTVLLSVGGGLSHFVKSILKWVFYFTALTPPADPPLPHSADLGKPMHPMFTNINTTNSTSLPNLAHSMMSSHRGHMDSHRSHLGNNTPSPLNDSMVSYCLSFLEETTQTSRWVFFYVFFLLMVLPF